MHKISAETVRADFNEPIAVVHYARAAHFLGLWKSEKDLIEKFFPDLDAPLLEAGCGAGRVTMGLWDLGYRRLTAFDFAEELVQQAEQLFKDRGATTIRLFHADATRLSQCHLLGDIPTSSITVPSSDQCHLLGDIGRTGAGKFAGVLFMFNGLMQIPGRENRREAMRQLAAVCTAGAPFLFTTHDRDHSAAERALWRLEKARWEKDAQDPRLVDYGDRYFEDESGRTFMHLPDRAEILEDLAATGWTHEFDEMRKKIAKESDAVRDFSDECRFWVARKRETK